MGAIAWSIRPSNPPLTVARFAFTLPEGQQFTESGLRVIAISRDGTQMVYVANRRLLPSIDGRGRAETHSGERGQRRLPSRSRVFARWAVDRLLDGTTPSVTLKKIAVTGGSPVTICQTSAPLGMSWDAEGILFGRLDGILRVAETGGQPQLLVGVEDGVPWRPQMLPGGDAVLFTLADRDRYQRRDSGLGCRAHRRRLAENE